MKIPERRFPKQAEHMINDKVFMSEKENRTIKCL